MNIIEYLKQIFSKKKINDTSVANLQNLFNIPKRKDFKDNPELISKIEEYKKTYIDILSQNGILTSKAIHVDSFQQNLNMNIDLLLNISLEEENEVGINSMVKIAKLHLYLEEITKINTDTKLRFIALHEIQKELIINIKLRYIPNRKNCISEELNNLSRSLLMFETQKCAINIEVNNCYLKLESTIDKPLPEELEKLTKKYNKLLETTKKLLKEESINYMNSFDNIIVKMAALEKELEKYVYTHSEDIDSMRIELQNLAFVPKKSKKELLADIESLEIKFLTFNEYGRNVVTDDDLYDLYKTKFNINTIDIEKLIDTPFKDIYSENRAFNEHFVYEQIIMEMIMDITTNKNNILTSKYKNLTNEDLKVILDLFKNSNNEYNPEDILKNNLLLTVLIYLCRGKDIEKLMAEYRIVKPSFIKKIECNQFNFEYYISMKTVLQILSYVDKENENNIILDEILIKIRRFYKVICPKTIEDGFYSIPDGIVTLSNDSNCLPISKRIIKTIASICDNKVVWTPPSLRYLNSNIFNNEKIDFLNLNEGLEILDGPKRFKGYKKAVDDNREIKATAIVIPITLAHIDKNAINYNYTDILLFNDYRESIILNNRDKLKELFTNIFQISFNNNLIGFLKSSINKILLYYNDKTGYYTINMHSFKKTIIIDEILEEFISLVEKETGYKLGSQLNQEIIENEIEREKRDYNLASPKENEITLKKS